ncbi:MAG: CBS domain-containing protein [Phycisphaerae bacterium]
MNCPSCHHDNIPGADVCETCGTDLITFDHAESGHPHADTSGSVTRTPLSGVASPPMVVVSPTTPVGEVIDRLVAGNASCALVVLEGDTLVGIVSERDILMRAAHRFEELRNSPVREVMTPAPDTLPPDATVAWALNRMDLGGFRHIPIEENERPVGVVSVRDLLNFLIDHYSPVPVV